MENYKKIILNIGCGTTRIPGAIGVDKFKIGEYVDVVHDLNVVPYPFEDNSVDKIHMYHVLEHLNNPLEKMEELHRILRPGGKLYIRVPHFSSMGAFSDMTHIRPFGHGSFECFVEGSYHSFYTKARFNILKKEIKYLGLYPNTGTYEKYIHHNQCNPITKPFVLILNFMIALSPMLFERLWCYWVGGATEVVVNLEKNAQQ